MTKQLTLLSIALTLIISSCSSPTQDTESTEQETINHQDYYFPMPDDDDLYVYHYKSAISDEGEHYLVAKPLYIQGKKHLELKTYDEDFSPVEYDLEEFTDTEARVVVFQTVRSDTDGVKTLTQTEVLKPVVCTWKHKPGTTDEFVLKSIFNSGGESYVEDFVRTRKFSGRGQRKYAWQGDSVEAIRYLETYTFETQQLGTEGEKDRFKMAGYGYYAKGIGLIEYSRTTDDNYKIQRKLYRIYDKQQWETLSAGKLNN